MPVFQLAGSSGLVTKTSYYYHTPSVLQRVYFQLCWRVKLSQCLTEFVQKYINVCETKQVYDENIFYHESNAINLMA